MGLTTSISFMAVITSLQNTTVIELTGQATWWNWSLREVICFYLLSSEKGTTVTTPSILYNSIYHPYFPHYLPFKLYPFLELYSYAISFHASSLHFVEELSVFVWSITDLCSKTTSINIHFLLFKNLLQESYIILNCLHLCITDKQKVEWCRKLSIASI